MKKSIFVFILLFIAILFGLNIYNRSKEINVLSSLKEQANKPKPSTNPVSVEETSAFVPYWVVGQDLPTEYDTLIYFGVSPNTNGIDQDDEGYKNLPRFIKMVDPSVKTLLTVRMLNNDTSFSIIEDTKSEEKVIADTIRIAKENNFDGIVLDLEVNALPFDSVVGNITEFSKRFATATKDAQLSYGMAMYGDVFYRFRPFNVQELAKHVDQIYIMSYDFHKSRGNPGPNFPYGGKEDYGYDFQTMIQAFLKDVPTEKLTVIFGMFGYDWEVDAKGKAVGNGEALSYNKIKQNFITSCTQKKCEYAQDTKSRETKLTYIDDNEKAHVVWFETPTSVAEKKRFIKSKGISGISYWAYSYF